MLDVFGLNQNFPPATGRPETCQAYPQKTGTEKKETVSPPLGNFSDSTGQAMIKFGELTVNHTYITIVL
jgi:hypothetical protein